MISSSKQTYFNFSANFDGMIALSDPEDSWVGKWQVSSITTFLHSQLLIQGIKTTRPGLYAISVSGTLNREIVADLRAHGFRYRPEMRDRYLFYFTISGIINFLLDLKFNEKDGLSVFFFFIFQ